MASINNMTVFSIDDFDSSYNMCIEASAGTGKTYTVQQIVGELLRLAPARSLENILIVTYTEKAAGELRDRIRAKIQEVIEKNDYNTSGDKKYLTVEQQKENFKKQLALVDNAPIFTIHSFCKQTLTEYGFNAKQCDNLELVDESEIKSFIDKWIRDDLPQDEFYTKLVMLTGKTINKDEYGKIAGFLYLNMDWQEVPEIITLDKTVNSSDYQQASRFTEDELLEYKTLTAMVNRKLRFNVLKLNFICNFSDKIRDANCFTPVTNTRTSDECETYRNNLKTLRDQIAIEESRRHSNTKEKAINDCDDLIRLYDAAKNSGIVVLGEDEVSKFPTDATKYFGTNGQNALCDYFFELKEKINEVHKFGASQEALLKRVVFENKITELYKSWNEYKANNKLQSFDDMIRNVREAVVLDNSELKQKLKDKYQYAIIDEFQDTNQKQWDIFSRVFMEDANHSICVVGDPKQSIYKFQGADINVYTKAINCIKSGNSACNVKPGKSFILDRNYRSTNNMIDFCNVLFKQTTNNSFFEPGDIVFKESGYPLNAAQVKPNAEYCDTVTPPVWIPKRTDSEAVTEEGFAEFAVQQIIDCCTYNDKGKTNLQIYKKNFKVNNALALTNVGFGDFAVLCKSKSEMEPLKKAFAMAGIPYNHYKEANLFNGQECRDWIALFQTIDADDFSSYNRRILNECLFSQFFGKSINEIQGNEFDRPDCPERQLIIKWQTLAKERKWALLQENIFENSKVEERLSSLDKLSSLSKLRQIGDYCVNYLYKNSCTIEELLNHLALLSAEKGDSDEEDGNIVEKGTDFNAVQIMTIHASKGLEFPVVICPAGMKGAASSSDGMYHDANSNLHISYDKTLPVKMANGDYKTAAELEQDEDVQEWRRKFYVAYTRASSLMIMPWTAKQEFTFLLNSYDKDELKKTGFLREIEYPADFMWTDIRKQVKAIIEKQVSKSALQDDSGETEQKAQLEKLSGEIRRLNTYKLSYSNLSHSKKQDEYDAMVTSGHNEEAGDDNSVFDTKIIRVPCNYAPENLTVINEKYPKGNLLGEAVHQTLEATDYKRIGKMPAAEAIAEDSAYIYMMRNKFRGQGFNAGNESFAENELQTCRIIWNTMNAVLPEIQGNCGTGRSFSLKELESNQHFAELEFNMNPDISQNEDGMRDYFNGFIDVLFTRTLEDGRKIYSVLDWKTNSLEPAGYADEEALNTVTNKEFSIQRVLYSYCLIKWLKQFNEGKSEEQIFNEQFGGIYYVYVRGCKAGNGNGIYAQTWESWSDLETAFKNIVDVKISKGKK